MTNLARKYAYVNAKNYINAQIAYTKEKIQDFSNVQDTDYIDDRQEELKAYKIMLNLLSDNMKKIIGNQHIQIVQKSNFLYYLVSH